MKTREAVVLCKELIENEDGSHYARALKVVLKELRALDKLARAPEPAPGKRSPDQVGGSACKLLIEGPELADMLECCGLDGGTPYGLLVRGALPGRSVRGAVSAAGTSPAKGSDMNNETRQYRIIPKGTRGFTQKITGAFGSDQAWRDAAKAAAGERAAGVDASYQAEQVIRLFPWWTQ